MDDKMISAPSWKWELNPNSIVAMLSIVVTIASCGALYSKLVDGNASQAMEIGKLSDRVTALEAKNSRVEALEYRMDNFDAFKGDVIATSRETAAAINSLASDQKVMKEILQRLEASQSRLLR